MSLVPLIFSDWWEDLDRPHHLLDQDFGVALRPEQLIIPQRLEMYMRPQQRRQPSYDNYIRTLADLLQKTKTNGVSSISADKDNFVCTLDVQQFKPEEIDVKVVDRHIVITAKHEEKRDEHGWISREFTRKYLVPEQCDISKVESKLSSDGVLTIAAPKKQEPKAKNERVIKIEHTGQPAIKSKEAAAPVEKKEEKK
ncbi:hypothetical protein QAD02_015484 [Eretmocerus hayati]|uniref:Uncharacterized protein n=1 Tax=Eretmocerus hayati TaxID=131215 RepID=A0ACC2P8E3_9HYME|nr:hypothetical protein QAD02_015484 [Eretmocerus hayati]